MARCAIEACAVMGESPKLLRKGVESWRQAGGVLGEASRLMEEESTDHGSSEV